MKRWSCQKTRLCPTLLAHPLLYSNDTPHLANNTPLLNGLSHVEFLVLMFASRLVMNTNPMFQANIGCYSWSIFWSSSARFFTRIMQDSTRPKWQAMCRPTKFHLAYSWVLMGAPITNIFAKASFNQVKYHLVIASCKALRPAVHRIMGLARYSSNISLRMCWIVTENGFLMGLNHHSKEEKLLMYPVSFQRNQYLYFDLCTFCKYTLGRKVDRLPIKSTSLAPDPGSVSPPLIKIVRPVSAKIVSINDSFGVRLLR